MALWFGTGENYIWSYHTEDVPEQGWQRWVDALGDMVVVDASQPRAVLTVVYQAKVPSATQRAAIAAVTSSPKFRGVVHAFVTDSMVLRGVLTALDWLRQKPYEERVFDDPVLAASWLQQLVPGVTKEVLFDAVRREVPPDLLWPVMRKARA